MSRKWIVTVVTLTANAISADPIMKNSFSLKCNMLFFEEHFFLSFHRKKLITKIESGSIIFLSLVLISFLICFYCKFDEQKDLSLGLSAKSWVLNFTRMPIAQYCALIHYNHGAQPVILHLSLRWWGDLYFLKFGALHLALDKAQSFLIFFSFFKTAVFRTDLSVLVALWYHSFDLYLCVCLQMYFANILQSKSQTAFILSIKYWFIEII